MLRHGAFDRIACTCRSTFTSDRHSPGRITTASSHEGHVTRSFPRGEFTKIEAPSIYARTYKRKLSNFYGFGAVRTEINWFVYKIV